MVVVVLITHSQTATAITTVQLQLQRKEEEVPIHNISMFAAKLRVHVHVPITRILIRRQAFVSTCSRPSNQLKVQLIANRCYAAAAAREPAMDEATVAHTDIVKDAVRDLLEQRSTYTSKSNRTEQLQHSYQNFMVSVLKCTNTQCTCCTERCSDHVFSR